MFSALNTVLRVGALCWVGLWFGLRAGSQARAILWTVILVEATPYFLGLGLSLLCRWLLVTTTGTSWASPWMLGLLVPQLPSLVFLLWVIRLARRQLGKEIAGAEPLSVGQVFRDALPGIAAMVHRARQWPPVQHST